MNPQAPRNGLRISNSQGASRVSGYVGRIPCHLTIDTGADVTIINSELYQKLNEVGEIEITPFSSKLKSVDGKEITVEGAGMVEIQIADVKVKQRVWILPSKEECILGTDFLREQGGVIDYQQGMLRVGRIEVPMERKKQEFCVRRVLLECNVKVPGYSEMIVCGRVEGKDNGVGCGVIGPTGNESKNLLIGRCVVNDSEGRIPVRVLNTSPVQRKLKKGMEIALLEPIIQISDLQKHDDPQTPNKNEAVPEHLKELYEKSAVNLNQEQREKVSYLLKSFKDVFSGGPNDLGLAKEVKHRIDTGDAQPVKQRPRNIPFAKRTEADRAVADMEKYGIVEPSSSPWCSPVVLVRKKDGTTRFCVDYRRLNHITKKDSFPIPRVDATLDALRGASWFSTLDLRSGYWQVELDSASKEKTAFSYGRGLWQFNVMPFGLCNAPATFERLMETVLAGLPWETCLIYLDDVIVHAADFDSHLRNLAAVLEKFRQGNLKLNPKKCCLFKSRVTFLGYVVSQEGISTDPEKISAITRWPTPKNGKEVKSFLGLCSYYRRFVAGFAEIAKPLHSLTQGTAPFSWTNDCENSFITLKQRLVETTTLSYPELNKPFILDTDASQYGIGAVLSQEIEGTERPIAYFSRTLRGPEINYCVTRKELLAVVNGMEHFHQYLYGTRFLVRSDHSALKWLLNFKTPEGQMARWIQKLQQYDFETEHRVGRQHLNADALSRRPCSDNDCHYCERKEIREHKNREEELQCSENPDELCQAGLVIRNLTSLESVEDLSLEDIEKAQKSDPEIRLILTWMNERPKKPSWQDVAPHSPMVKSLWGQWKSLKVVEERLYRCLEEGKDAAPRLQLVIPKSLRSGVMKQLHDNPTAGHFGITKTLDRIRERFYWPHCRNDVEVWCKSCEKCASRKGPGRKQTGPLKTYNVGAPLERIAVDVLGPLPCSLRGNKYILIVGDYFTKWVEAYPLKDQQAETVAEVLVKEFITRFGVPLLIHSDQGRNFESELFSQTCKLLGIHKTRTTALHPQSDGMVERFNRTLENQMAIFANKSQQNWDENLPLFLMAYRSAVHESTKETPAKLMFGRELNLPIDLLVGRPPGKTIKNVPEYVRNLQTEMEKTHEFARLRLQCASERMKRRYDTDAMTETFSCGEAVWLYNPKRRKGISPKLSCDWEGPYLVIKPINELLYSIQKSARSKPYVVHRNRLWKYYESKEAGNE